MFINNPFAGAFGLDIGDASIKLVRLEKKWRPRRGAYFEVRDIRQISLPAGCIVSGELLQPELVKEKIKILLSHHKKTAAIGGTCVVADLPAAKTFLKLIQVTAAEKEIGDEIVKLEAAKHLPLDIREMNIDWQIVKNGEAAAGTTPILVGAVPTKISNDYNDLLISCDLQPLALEIEDLAIARALITASKTYEGEARAILDLGASRSSIIIYDKGSIQFSALINFSGDIIDTTLVQRLKIERSVATDLKIKYGISYADAYPEYLKIMTEITEKLADSISQTMLFYRDHFHNPNPITHITMSGGLSAMENLDKFLTEKLKTVAAPGDIWKNLFNKNLDFDIKTGLALTSAIGLAIRATAWPNKIK
jgi:type IV pilus assembly protein PilM